MKPTTPIVLNKNLSMGEIRAVKVEAVSSGNESSSDNALQTIKRPRGRPKGAKKKPNVTTILLPSEESKSVEPIV